MKEVMRSNDPVRLSWAKAVLAGEAIAAVEFDRHAAVLDGSILAIQRRLMVADEDLEAALAVLAAAEPDAAGEPAP
ncbi:MAG: DUF2007 domain-containing protein [Rhodospirillaceae bacterium]|nr:DUF2007 domain-containing protein [Rhodospirillaceae bacterium]